MDTASKASLENEFGSSNVDECLKKVIKEGNVLTGSVRHRSNTMHRPAMIIS